MVAPKHDKLSEEEITEINAKNYEFVYMVEVGKSATIANACGCKSCTTQAGYCLGKAMLAKAAALAEQGKKDAFLDMLKALKEVFEKYKLG